MMKRALLSPFLALLLAVPLLVAPATPAAAAPAVKLDPSTIEVGQTTRIEGSGFQPGPVIIYLGSPTGPVLAKGEHRGAFNFLLDVSGLTADTYSVLACNNQARNGECREEATAVLSIQPASPPTTRQTTTSTERVTTSSSRRTTSTGRVTTSSTRPPTSGTPSTEPPSTAVISTTTTVADDIAVASTPDTVDTPDPSLGISTTTGPDPTFDPDPDGLAISSTTSGPAYIPPDNDPEDLYITGIEVSQGIQSMTSSMPLVAERTTWVRVHVDNGGPGTWVDVDGLLLLQRAGMDDLELVPSNGPIVTKRPRTDIDATLNFEIPDAYLGDGDLSIWAGVWSVVPSSVENEPNPNNNILHLDVEFHEADTPTIWLVALDDGAGPGPVVNDLIPLLDFAKVVHQDLLDLHPTAEVNYHVYPVPLEPGPEAVVPGVWNLGLDADDDDPDAPSAESADTRRHEPNMRMAMVYQDIPEHENMLGWIHPSIPTGGYSGWAGYGVAWNKPSAGTPAHELAHSRGLGHVACKDDNGDGVPDELAGGPLDPTHPTALPPNCSLAPISPFGYYGLTTEQETLTVYSNDPTDAAAAYPYMSYKNPGWADPYHWCLLLQEVGVPCSPASIGVPPKAIQPAADCDPEPAGNGIGMDLCLIDQLPPPSDPLGGEGSAPAAVPWTGSSHYGLQPLCDGALDSYLRRPLDGAGCGTVQAGDGTTEHFFTVEIGEGPIAADSFFDIIFDGDVFDTDNSAADQIDGTDWAFVYGFLDPVSGESAIQHVERRTTIPNRMRNRFLETMEGVLSGAAPSEAVLTVARPSATRPGAIDVFAQVPVETGLGEGGHGGGSAQGPVIGFVQAIPMPTTCGDCFIQLRGVAGESEEVPISPAAPAVTAVTATDTGSATLIEWAASDPDGDSEFTFDVLWATPDGGWIHAATAISDTSISVPHDARFPGGDDVVVRVVANDGVNTGEATSDPFSAPTNDPLLFTTGVPDEGAVEQYDTVLLQAHLVDPESTGAAPESVTWTSSLDGPLGSGPLLRTRDLSVGSHTIEVSAADEGGAVAVDSFELEITSRVRPTRYLEEPDADGVAFLRSGAAGLGGGQGGEGTLASAGALADDLAGGLPGGLFGLAALVGVVAVTGAAGGWAFSRRRFR